MYLKWFGKVTIDPKSYKCTSANCFNPARESRRYNLLTYRSKTVLLVDPLTLSDAILAPWYAQTQEVICNDYQKYVCRNVKMYAIAELDIGRGKAALKEQASKATPGLSTLEGCGLAGTLAG